MSKFDIKDMTGVIPALITCFDKDENLDLEKMKVLTNHLISKGIDGLYLTGSTGEGFLMTSDERKSVVETVVKEVNGRVPVIVHVGDIGTKKSIDHAVHAYETGADAISSVPPFYWRFNAEQIYGYYKDIADATPLPMIVYNVPLAGAMGMDTIKKLAEIENVKGLKYTLTTHFEITLLKEELGEDFIIYSGCDEMSLSGLGAGADGLIGSFYNLMPEVFIDIYNAVKKNDLEKAKAIQANATHVIMYCVQYNYLSLMKEALGWIGVEAGYCRKPFNNLTEEEMTKVKADLTTMKKELNITGIEFMDAL